MPRNADWWKTGKPNLQRRASPATPRSQVNPGDSFLIVTEGLVERVYFELLRESLLLSSGRVEIRSSPDSDPKSVVRAAAHGRRPRRNQPAIDSVAEFDHVWAVIDTDVAVRDRFWDEVVQLADESRVRLAHSTPCFEYWLLLHLGMTTGSLMTGDAAKRAFRRALRQDYSTNGKVAERALTGIIRQWPVAVRNAQRVRQYHDGGGTPSPANPSTEGDRLACALNDAALPYVRQSL